MQELKTLAIEKGVDEQVIFVPSCSTLQRNALLAACVCVLYTPMVSTRHLVFLLVIKLVSHTEINHREFVLVVLAGKSIITYENLRASKVLK